MRDRLCSGQVDLLWENDTSSVGVIIDYKTGRDETTEAVGNMQLRTLAVLVASLFDFERIHVAIIQPHASPQISTCTYTAEDLETAEREIRANVEAAMTPGAQRVAGEKQCKHCRAKRLCPEYFRYNTTLDKLLPTIKDQSIKALSPQRLGEWLDMARLFEQRIAEIRENLDMEARGRLEAGEEVLGWKLKPGNTVEKITDIRRVWENLVVYEPSTEFHKFIRVCTITKSRLQDLLKETLDLRGNELETAIETVTEGATETTQNKPSLVKAKV